MAGPRRAATRVVVIHWNASEGAERVERLRRAGFDARLHRPDLDQIFVRAFGLARGFVDYKICAIDSTWSGLCFSRRK